jgi:hypothetical protein
MWPVWLYHFVQRYIVNGAIFGGGVSMNIKFVKKCVKLHGIPQNTLKFHVFFLDQLFYNEWPDDGILLGRNM